ncbi:class I SAM-dependent methyltransferase [Mesorhizobium sp. B2-2-4]|uniref:50S ribosomal protein L11 methyltransferase n=1 Tax=unclassified Mesorhizobium TaxID=325217 RepID=UPI00112C2976|nr:MULTISPECIES: 50S ribosomal protein L11 methyltransferase [unclassified Mesorhizobium]TPJ46858.1 class I SAM-dependent methyltransferase [Mesorhizobium sp. B2-6-6]MBZ9998733.1 50S ribosomal protein L11 methyltransferase [Mesorhizobium sp. B264B2A]MCA0005278.1 50S ribosomal protein L11 methyltransferase [Mesorhizobium sp. B264B1B]MCA0017219.1 50S ribosomal protein L11 methyltransferase [Mesorhizobium sp. B264B1A]TPL57094.1 class I SAM-dependent methyltransferase [Mesorhizobium sp. B2-4-2]
MKGSGLVFEDGSFRDPSGSVFVSDGRVFRTVTDQGKASYEAARDAGILLRYAELDKIVRTSEVAPADWPEVVGKPAYVLEHGAIPFLSYPYEWSFGALKAAALHHLDLQIQLLAENFVLSDASAYNVQFVGSKPIFIDILSVRPYRDGEYWTGHRQFCEQFLNPLLLRAVKGIAHNSWFRGALEGISTRDFARLLTFSERFSWNMLTHVTLQSRLEQSSVNDPSNAVKRVSRSRKLPRAGYHGILSQLRRWIARLEPADTGKTVWGAYASMNTYSSQEASTKRQMIHDFAASGQVATAIDLGCNTGDFSVAALEGGAKAVVGFDFDQTAVDIGFSRAASAKMNFLPLWLDAANPSPDQGWAQKERKGFSSRFRADAVLALAFEHHLAIGRNVPLHQAVKWIVDVAPTGIIEFVPKDDPTIRHMLALREDIFPDYNPSSFECALTSVSRIAKKQTVSATGRTLYQFDRR